MSAAGPEEPNALVQVDWPTARPSRCSARRPCRSRTAWSCRACAGSGRLDDRRRRRRAVRQAATPTVEVLVVGAGGGRARPRRRPSPGSSETRSDRRRCSIGRATPARDRVDGVRARTSTALGDLRPRLRDGAVRAAPDAPTTEGRLWHIRGRADRARDRRHRAADRLRRQRPARDHARRRGRDLRRALRRRGPASGRWSSRTTTPPTPWPPTLVAAGIEVVAIVDARAGASVVGTTRRRRRPPDGGGRIVRGRRRGRDRRRRTCCSCPAAGTRTSPCGRHARGTLRFDDADRRPSSRTGPGRTAGCEVVGAAARRHRRASATIAPTWVVPPSGTGRRPSRGCDWATHYVDLERDATVRDLQRALGAGLESIEHVKRYTTIGTGSDQGKTVGRRRVSAIAAALLGQEVGAVGVPTFRPPYRAGQLRASSPAATAATCSTRSGPRRSTRGTSRTAPCSRTSASGSGRATSRATASRWTRRSCASARAARTGVAVMDASTLGKIDIQGPDAGDLPRPRLHEHVLDAQGRRRAATALMCRLDGMVFDDGVTIAPGRRPVPHDDDDRQRRRRARPPGGVAPDRVAGRCGSTRPASPSSGRRSRVVGPRSREVVAPRWRRTSTCRTTPSRS